jgi:hypothetical protein
MWVEKRNKETQQQRDKAQDAGNSRRKVFGIRRLRAFGRFVVYILYGVLDDMIGVLLYEIADINRIDAFKLLDIFDDGETRGNHDVAYKVLVVEFAAFSLHGCFPVFR